MTAENRRPQRWKGWEGLGKDTYIASEADALFENLEAENRRLRELAKDSYRILTTDTTGDDYEAVVEKLYEAMKERT